MFYQYQFQAPRLLGGGQDSQISCPGNHLCAVIDIEFSADIAGMNLDCVQREVKQKNRSTGMSSGLMGALHKRADSQHEEDPRAARCDRGRYTFST